MVTVTPQAVREVKRLLEKEGKTGQALRLMVKGGGCSGLSYDLEFDTQARERDLVYEFEGLKVFVDPKSYLYLKGITLDFSGGLNGKGFQFKNPNATGSCSCGESFSIS
jgi:iron-sulfur cluster assembly protein